MEDLSFYTNEELISELLNRTTFAGLIVRPVDPVETIHKGDFIEFQVSWSHRLPEVTIIRILKEALSQIGG